jgi:hypothetical protein
MLSWPGKTTPRPNAPWSTSCCLPTIPGALSPESHPPRGAASWTTPLADASSGSPTNPCIAATPPCGPSSSTAWPCLRSPSSSAPPTTPCAPGCATSAPPAGPARFPPFRRATSGPTGPRRQLRGTGPASRAGHRRRPLSRPGAGAAAAHPGGGCLPLPPLVSPPGLRHPGQTGRLSGLAHGPRCGRAAQPAGTEVARQGAPQSHQRLQLRRGARPVRRPERPAEEELTPPTTPTAPRGPTSSTSCRGGSPGWRHCCSPRPRRSASTSTRSPTAANPRPWRTTTCPCAARPARAS